MRVTTTTARRGAAGDRPGPGPGVGMGLRQRLGRRVGLSWRLAAPRGRVQGRSGPRGPALGPAGTQPPPMHFTWSSLRISLVTILPDPNCEASQPGDLCAHVSAARGTVHLVLAPTHHTAPPPVASPAYPPCTVDDLNPPTPAPRLLNETTFHELLSSCQPALLVSDALNGLAPALDRRRRDEDMLGGWAVCGGLRGQAGGWAG